MTKICKNLPALECQLLNKWMALDRVLMDFVVDLHFHLRNRSIAMKSDYAKISMATIFIKEREK